jgi:multiple sugar transport system substrate-binding protein
MLGMRVHDLADEVGFVAVPAGPMGFPASVTGTMVYGIFRQAADPKQAMRLLEHVVAPDALARVAQATGRIPPRRSAIALAAAASPFVAMTAEILEHAVTRPATPVYPRVSAQLAAMLEAVLTDRLTAPAAVRRTAEMVGAITGLPVLHDLGATPRAAPIG